MMDSGQVQDYLYSLIEELGRARVLHGVYKSPIKAKGTLVEMVNPTPDDLVEFLRGQHSGLMPNEITANPLDMDLDDQELGLAKSSDMQYAIAVFLDDNGNRQVRFRL